MQRGYEIIDDFRPISRCILETVIIIIIIIIIHSLRHKTAHKTYKTYKKSLGLNKNQVHKTDIGTTMNL